MEQSKRVNVYRDQTVEISKSNMVVFRCMRTSFHNVKCIVVQKSASSKQTHLSFCLFVCFSGGIWAKNAINATKVCAAF